MTPAQIDTLDEPYVLPTEVVVRLDMRRALAFLGLFACGAPASEPVEEPPPGCSAGPEQCCTDDGRLATPCGPIGGGACENATCRGEDGRCFPCRCLAADVRIDTPEGELPVSAIEAGTIVWSMHEGERRAVRVIRAARAAVPDDHLVYRVRLADGREVRLSEGHPFANGARPEELAIGASLDASTVIEASRVRYDDAFTYDLLPESDSGAYWANGILVRSTFRSNVREEP